MLGQRLAQRIRVLDEDVHPDARVGSGHARHVAERATGAGERLVPLHPGRAGLVDEHVRERVRKMAGEGDQAIVRDDVDRDRVGAERADEAM